nr:hypothetical protein [Tanacetum cinerariifolium]
MNQEEIRQVTARDEKWVPTKERFKIGTSNVRLDTTVLQKEQTFQVIIDLIKNSTFLLKSLKSLCSSSGTLLRRVQREEFTEVPIDGSTLTFLIDLGYKGPLYKHPSMENIYYPKLIWEDFAFLIDHMMEKQRIRKKAAVSPKHASVKVSIKSDFEPASKRTGNRRVIKKKVSISTDDNIIPEPNVALELGKSISLTKAVEEELARLVHASHERIVTEYDTEPARRRTSESKKISKQPNIRGSSKETGSIPRVSNESTIVFSPSSERTGAKPGVADEEKVTSEAKADESTDEDEEKKEDDDADDDKSIDLEKTDDEETNDEFVHSEEYVQENNKETDDEFIHDNEQVNDDADEEMTNVEDANSGNGDEEITNAAKTEEVKDDIKKAELPPSGSNLSVSSGFGNQFLNLSFDTSLIVAPATTLLPPLFVSFISNVLLQITTPIPTPPITTEAPPITMIPDLLHAIIQRVPVLEKDVQDLKEVDNNTTLQASPRSEIPSAINAFLGSSSGYALHKVLQKHMKELIQKYSQQVDYKEMIKEFVQANIINEVKNQLPKFLPKAVSDFATLVIQRTIKKALEKTLLEAAQSSSQAQSSLKAAESFRCKFFSRKRDCDDEDLLAGSNQGKKTKRSRTKESKPPKKSSTTKETSKGPVYKLSKGTCTSNTKLEYNMEECFKALTVKLDWKNPKGDRFPFEFTKTLPLKGHPGRLTIAVEYFFNIDLEFLKSSYLKEKYTTSIMKTKAAWYEIVGIEGMVPTLWSTTKVGYNKDVEKGIKHWGDKQIMVRRADHQLYKFKEGDFIDPHLNDTEDMLLLVVQHKLFQLDGSDIIDFIMAIHKKRSELMVELIDKQMRERRIIRNLERLVGAWELEMDYRLMIQHQSDTKVFKVTMEILPDPTSNKLCGRPNGEALRKCILSGPHKPTTVLVQAVYATDDSPSIPEHTTVEKPMNMSSKNKAHFEAEKEEMWEAIERLQQGESLNIQDVKTNLFWEFALVAAAQANQDPYYQTSRSHKSHAPSSKPLIPTRSQTTTKHKGKEIAKPITPPFETASEEDNDPEQAQRDKDMQKNLALISKYFKKIYKPTNNNLRTSSNSRNQNVDTTPRYKDDNQSGQFQNQRTVNVAEARENVGVRKPKRVKDSAYHKEKILLCKQAEQGVPLQAEQYDWLADTDEEVDKQELEAHYSYMAKIQEVPTADT